MKGLTLACTIFACLAGCSARLEKKEETVNHEEDPPISREDLPLRPSWHLGDTWDVDYRILTVSPEKSEDPAPRYVELRRRYEVVSITEDRVSVIASAQDGQLRLRLQLEFSAASSRLLAVSPPHYGKAVPEHPYLPLRHDMMGENNEAWPLFPLQSEQISFTDEMMQSVVELPQGVKVTIFRRGNDMGGLRERTVTQRWEQGNPWWSSMTIVGRTTWEGTAYEEAEVEGTFVAWHPAKVPTP